MFVAHVPELDVSSCGGTTDEARRNIRDAVQGFLETSEEMGTLTDILEEAGYQRDGDCWRWPELVLSDRLSMRIG